MHVPQDSDDEGSSDIVINREHESNRNESGEEGSNSDEDEPIQDLDKEVNEQTTSGNSLPFVYMLTGCRLDQQT